MRLLVITQAVDRADPVLGFFHRWIEEFAKHCKTIEVMCLKEGAHALPSTVRVHSLGKERRASRLTYLWRFYRYMWSLRHSYDAVFVHMNPEYVLLGGIFWRLMGKRIVLWRNHKMPGAVTFVAAHHAHAVCYTSPAAYVARFKHAVQMPIGIDTKLFHPAGVAPPRTILMLGRLDEIKRPHVFLEALALLEERNLSYAATLVGAPTHPHTSYAKRVSDQAEILVTHGTLTRRASVPHAETAAIFRAHAIYVNLTPSGSFDKTIGEAASSGCTLVVANEVLKEVLPNELLIDPDSAGSVASGIAAALEMTPAAREALVQKTRRFVEAHHSLDLLCDRLLAILSPARV